MGKIRVVIADDHGVLRGGLRSLINSQPDMEVCAEASDGEEAIAVTASTRPDIVLLDLKMPTLGGVAALSRIRRAHESARILVLSMHDDEAYLRDVLRGGAAGYVLKSAVDVELLSAIRAVHKGGVYLDPNLSRAVVGGFLSADAEMDQGAGADDADPLSDREREVLQMLARGHTNQQIADKFYLSVKTVEGYRARIVEKTGLRGRAALTAYAIKKGMLS